MQQLRLRATSSFYVEADTVEKRHRKLLLVHSAEAAHHLCGPTWNTHTPWLRTGWPWQDIFLFPWLAFLSPTYKYLYITFELYKMYTMRWYDSRCICVELQCFPTVSVVSPRVLQVFQNHPKYWMRDKFGTLTLISEKQSDFLFTFYSCDLQRTEVTGAAEARASCLWVKLSTSLQFSHHSTTWEEKQSASCIELWEEAESKCAHIQTDIYNIHTVPQSILPSLAQLLEYIEIVEKHTTQKKKKATSLNHRNKQIHTYIQTWIPTV